MEPLPEQPIVAYFSLAMGLDVAIPTYSGGLGVLAGDTLRAAADMGLPMVGMTLLYRKGYFSQRLDARGNQSEGDVVWAPEAVLEPVPARVAVIIAGRAVQVCAWRYVVPGVSGHTVAVYLLDTDLEGNSPRDRRLTDRLYGGDQRHRLCQEAVLGLGGVALLRALGYRRVQAYHMNEGHSALLVLALLEEETQGRGPGAATSAQVEAVRQRCVFTTHTPVPSGHDKFPLPLVRRVLGEARAAALDAMDGCQDGALDTTRLGLSLSRYVNGVTLRHGKVSRSMYPNHPINSITNGVHAVTWTAPPFQRLYDREVPGWRRDSNYLRYAVGIPLEEIQEAHAEAKRELLAEVERRTARRLEPTAMTLGFARRATAYKRPDLLFSDLERLKGIARRAGPLQVIYAGKAHPRDRAGKALIPRIFEAAAALADTVPVVYLEDYDMALARYLCAGVDLWLNTPQKPLEASGTSGMKAALNGVPSLSVLDGWWIEGHVEGVTGWAIGGDWETESDPSLEVASLYDKLEHDILPLFHARPAEFARVMRSAIALNGSFFSAQRMLSQYVAHAYHLLSPAEALEGGHAVARQDAS